VVASGGQWTRHGFDVAAGLEVTFDVDIAADLGRNRTPSCDAMLRRDDPSFSSPSACAVIVSASPTSFSSPRRARDLRLRFVLFLAPSTVGGLRAGPGRWCSRSCDPLPFRASPSPRTGPHHPRTLSWPLQARRCRRAGTTRFHPNLRGPKVDRMAARVCWTCTPALVTVPAPQRNSAAA